MIKIIIILTSMLGFLAGCGETPPEKMTSGKELYNYYCKECHDSEKAKFQIYNEKLKPYQVVLMIKYGYKKNNHGMMVFSQLSEKQADAVASYFIKLQMASQH